LIAHVLTQRKQDLERRIERLPKEVAAWKSASETVVDKRAHFSQLRAIDILTDTYVKEQRLMLQRLDPAGPVEEFNSRYLDVVVSIIRSQKTWDFFRDKLNLRYSPLHKDALWTADTVAWDCHRPVLDKAVELGILDASSLREPPLVYCTADYSPATWVRGSRPNDGRDYHLGQALLPIPVIEMPWDHLGNSWEYLPLHHEVGHDIEADLMLRPALGSSLQDGMTEADVPSNRQRVWHQWMPEVFADLCALQLAGPAFGETLAALLLLRRQDVVTFADNDPHPTPYVRILLVSSYIRTLTESAAVREDAERLEAFWKEVYGAVSSDLDEFRCDFVPVLRALMDTPLSALRGYRVRELMPYGINDDAQVRPAADYFRTGQRRPTRLRIRHAPAAARLAIAKLAEAGELSAQRSEEVHGRVLDYVKAVAPPVLRGSTGIAHERFIAGFARKAFSE
jgi:hypothetical protein